MIDSVTNFPAGEELPSHDVPAGEYPLKVIKDSGKVALVVQAAHYTRYLGNLTVLFDRNGDVASWEGNPILLDSSVAKGTDALLISISNFVREHFSYLFLK